MHIEESAPILSIKGLHKNHDKVALLMQQMQHDLIP